MKILIAPDKFRGSLEAWEVCEAARKGVLEACPEAEVVVIPLADGGEGTARILTRQAQGTFVEVVVQDPLGRDSTCRYGISGDGTVAFIEMAAASGLQLLAEDERNPLRTTSFGTGQLLLHALESGVHTIILGIGGSATTDGGMGIAAALGYRFLDRNGCELAPTGGNLSQVMTIDPQGKHPQLGKTRILVACDVTNPLYGPHGAAYVYGPQKGANDEEVCMLDDGLRHFAEIATAAFGYDVSDQPGAGAAGGVGAGALWFLRAALREGVRIVMEQTGLNGLVGEMDLVITGEGKVDEQTLQGKVVKGLAGLCLEANVPLTVVCGTLMISPQEARQAGIAYAVSAITRPQSLAAAQGEAFERVTEAAYYLTSLFLAGKSNKR